MILYHGTDTQAARRIAREGLKPDVAKFEVVNERNNLTPIGQDEHGYVYLTESFDIARGFAILRANYYRAQVGEYPYYPYLKTGGPHKCSARPAIVEIDLPDYWPTEDDPECADWHYAHRVRGAIPAQYVNAIYSAKTGNLLKQARDAA